VGRAIARQVCSEATRLAAADRSALERELQEAMLGHYAAHGAPRETLRRSVRREPRLQLHLGVESRRFLSARALDLCGMPV